MDWKKRIIRYSKRVFYPGANGGIAFFLVKGINYILNSLDPGWLIIILMPIAQVVLPLGVAFYSLCRQMYKEAEEDGELEEILKTTPPIFKRHVRINPPADDDISDVNQEAELCDAVDCSNPESHADIYQEKDSQDFVQQTVTEDEKEDVQEQGVDPGINTSKIELQSKPAADIPPTLETYSVMAEAETKAGEVSASSTTTESESAENNADPGVEDALPDNQKPDVFNCIRAPQNMAHYIVLDIETTGFSRDDDRIIEIAAIHYVFGEEATRFHTFINPQMQIPKHITRLTGIRQDDVDDAPLIEDIADDFCEFIKDYPLVGHNIVDFDLPFLKRHISLNESHFTIDTLDMARTAFPLLPSHKLSDLNFWFHLNNGNPHRADADAAAANALMWACLYPDKYSSLYRKAIRNGPPEVELSRKSRAYRHFDRICTTEIKPNPDRSDKFKPLLGKKIVFTSELSMARNDAMQMAVDAGALLRASVSSKTDILVVGKQDISVVGKDGMSTKQEKAQAINASGKGNVKIINEPEFMAMISVVSDSGTI